VENYLNDKITGIDELEQERLLLDDRENPGYNTLPLWHSQWTKIVTASVL
jgi:hypothetical protein